jgi:hypothetical protein
MFTRFRASFSRQFLKSVDFFIHNHKTTLSLVAYGGTFVYALLPNTTIGKAINVNKYAAVCDSSIYSTDKLTHYFIPEEKYNEFLHEISSSFPEQVEIDREECKQRGKPWNSYHYSGDYPRAIISPRNTEEVSTIMKLCHKYRVPVIPFGGGTRYQTFAEIF